LRTAGNPRSKSGHYNKPKHEYPPTNVGNFAVRLNFVKVVAGQHGQF